MAVELDEIARPWCPQGHDGRVVQAGVRLLRKGALSRPRYWCYPEDLNTPRHRFTAPRQHRTSDHPSGKACPTCETEPGRTEGPLVAWKWGFSAREIGDSFINVGRGLTYRASGTQLRLDARRYPTDRHAIPIPSREGGTVQRFLDALAPAVIDAVAHHAWPRILLLDAIPIRVNEADEEGRPQAGSEAEGAFLVAGGYTEPVEQNLRPQRPEPGEEPAWRWEGPKRRPHPWRFALAGTLDTPSWLDFLASLEGEPEWIVIDGDPAVRAAIRERWGNRPVVYSCEGHLQINFADAATLDGHPPVVIDRLILDAFRDEASWWEFVFRVTELPAQRRTSMTAWIERTHDLVLDQMRRRIPGYPRSIGALEATIVTLNGWIGDRRLVFQNVRRTNLTLELMRAQLGGHADAGLYAQVIRDAINAEDARPDIDWRAGHDHYGIRTFFALVADSKQRGAAYRAIRQASDWTDAKNRSVMDKVVAANRYRASIGFPPLALSGAKTLSVVSGGQWLNERPEIAREWDYERNEKIPEQVTAGSGLAAHWICVIDPAHRWQAKVSQRTTRLSGCPDCARPRQGSSGGRPIAEILLEHPFEFDIDEVFDPPPADEQARSGWKPTRRAKPRLGMGTPKTPKSRKAAPSIPTGARPVITDEEDELLPFAEAVAIGEGEPFELPPF